MPPALRAIVVGTGFGCRIHVPALRAAGFEVAGLVGTDPDRREAVQNARQQPAREQGRGCPPSVGLGSGR